MKLNVYADRMSQPVRAVLIFCKVNGINYEEVRVDIAKRQHLTPEYAEINPMKQLPAIVDGRFKLFESHAILTYLACSFPGVADHWYPDVFKRITIVRNTVLGFWRLCLAVHSIQKQLLKLLDESDWDRLLDPYKKVQQWIENTRNATNPHFDEVHKVLTKAKEKRQKQIMEGVDPT